MVSTAVQSHLMKNPNLLEGYLALVSLIYLGESLPVQLIHRLLKGQGFEKASAAYLKKATQEIKELTKEDIRRICKGDYPLSVLSRPDPVNHVRRLPELYWDSIKVSLRRRNKEAKSFSPEAREHLQEVPDYFRRNFHFQTDGYLSADSARLYDHQVEILFKGTASLMRRMILWGLRDHAKAQGQGEGLKILEIACGNGNSTVLIAKTLPKAQITCVDLSSPYLKQAQKRLKNYPRVNFVKADAANLDFKDKTFDIAVSVFLFHELPLSERKKVLAESMRVLKPGGSLGMVDSLQTDDVPELNWGLEFFPKEFHEPFYKNYVNNHVETLFAEAGASQIEASTAFVSKLVFGQKNEL